jgi:mannitol-specific phosphotransferase system IIBC component
MNFKKILCSKNKKQISTKIGIAVILIVAFTAGVFMWKWEKMQKFEEAKSQMQIELKNKNIKQQEDNIAVKNKTSNNKKTEEVSFCGKVYNTYAVKVKGIDITQKISKILTAKKYKDVCKNYEINTKDGDFLDVILQPNQDGSTYFNIFVYKYKIDSNDNIYILNSFDGTPELIGILK